MEFMIYGDGFDYKVHAKGKQVLRDEEAVVTDIYNSSGTESFLDEELETALTCYGQAPEAQSSLRNSETRYGSYAG